MAFKFSLEGAVAKVKALSREEEDEQARVEKIELERLMANFMVEHGKKSVLGEPAEDNEIPENIFVPKGNKRHFTGRLRTMKSGPGTLDPLDGFPRPDARFQIQSKFGGSASADSNKFDNSRPTENVFSTLVAKVSNLPPTIDSERVKELFAPFQSLKVTNIDKITPHGPATKGRPSVTMKVVFDKDANTRDLDSAMNKLNDKKYLGKGYYLHLDRYLGGRTMNTGQRSEPFGARWQAPEMPKGYAPPPDLGGGYRSRDNPRQDTEQLIVTANQPPDKATMRLVHQTIESVILGGVEFEATLMNDARVQEEERFAWLYDQKHPVNRYYRWRMHQVVCDTANAEIFARQGVWVGPPDPLPDEFVDNLGAFEVDDNHMSSEEDDDEKLKPQYKALPLGDNYPGRDDKGYGIMGPRSRAFLLWLLTSIPPGSILADDLAAISAFAVEHAAQGMDEVIHVLTSNVLEPIQLTDANPRKWVADPEAKEDARRPDIRQVTSNALRIISDVLFVTGRESGVSYKYRQAFGIQMVERKVFEHLEQLPMQLEMGRMTERTYRDDVNTILKIWNEERLFDEATLRHLDDAFNAKERQKEEEERARKLAERRKRKKGKIIRKTPAVDRGDNENAAMDLDTEEYSTPGANKDNSTSRDVTASAVSSPAPVLDWPTSEATEPVKIQASDTSQRAAEVEVPDETAAARARRLRPTADMFASEEE